MSTRRAAWQAGRDALNAGLPPSACPHGPAARGTPENIQAMWWRIGYRSALPPWLRNL